MGWWGLYRVPLFSTLRHNTTRVSSCCIVTWCDSEWNTRSCWYSMSAFHHSSSTTRPLSLSVSRTYQLFNYKSFINSACYQQSCINRSLILSRFIYCYNASKRQTYVIDGHDPKGPCDKSELARLITGRIWTQYQLIKRLARFTPRSKCLTL